MSVNQLTVVEQRKWGGTSFTSANRTKVSNELSLSLWVTHRAHCTYVERCFVWRWFFKLVVLPPWATFCLHSIQIAQLPLSAVVRFKTGVFPHNGDATAWRYDQDSLASILHVVTQFAHAHNWLGVGHLKPVNLQNTSHQLINWLTVTGSQHYFGGDQQLRW